MKTHLLLITLAVSSAAWAADPATETVPPAAETAAPAAPATKPAAETQAAPAAASEQKAAQASEQEGFSRGSVVRSIFTTAVKDREPVDKLNNNKSSVSHVYFFTELRDMSGQTAIHRWEHNGKVAAEVKFKVRGPRWRVWSSKTFNPTATGEWKVSVVNGAGDVIAEDMMDYTGPAAPAEKPATKETPAAAPQQAPATTETPAAPQQ